MCKIAALCKEQMPTAGFEPATSALPWRCSTTGATRALESTTGIEPAPSAWQAEVLPLNYIDIMESVTGVEPAIFWVEARYVSQLHYTDIMAESKGIEPSIPCGTLVFKTSQRYQYVKLSILWWKEWVTIPPLRLFRRALIHLSYPSKLWWRRRESNPRDQRAKLA